MRRLEGQVGLITGGAQGLGEALTERLIKEGASIVVADINYEKAQQVAKRLNAGVVKCDVRDFDDCDNAVKTIIDSYGRLDLLVSNAAIYIAGAITEFDPENWKKVIDVNLCGSFNIMKASATAMIKQRSGCIIQINSKSGKKGSYKSSAYPASKFGGIGLVQSLALELAEYNIRVNAICPGNLLDSPMWVNDIFQQIARNLGISTDEVRKKYVDQVPMKRGCAFEDIANVLVFLASKEADYMTGQSINVTGGQEMR